ncbi:uncharacterized protein Dmoj_GI26499 [Drosophila mojavensis]|uniref:Uncharacterized protein n=1 Tax=Drosophila mojavensis TaxID=7230 RepID=A0A0Q9XJH4_DROMO|nr:uncharacterized protein Dmoj_GI26499 [Drosophila mojavensis]
MHLPMMEAKLKPVPVPVAVGVARAEATPGAATQTRSELFVQFVGMIFGLTSATLRQTNETTNHTINDI